MPSWKRRVQTAAANLFAIPPDAISDVPRVTCVNGASIVIENVVSLKHVASTEVRVDAGSFQVAVKGDGFQVDLVAGGELHLSGTVESIQFLRTRGDVR